MKNMTLAIIGLVLVGLLGLDMFLMSSIARKQGGRVACTMEAKICPDGSAVGRSGPSCAFAPCPDASETPRAKLDQTIVLSGVSITPTKVISDSRCPTDVVCIQAGTIEVRTRLLSEGGEQIADLKLHEPITFAGKRIELVDATPAPHSKKQIADAERQFEYRVTSPGRFLWKTTSLGSDDMTSAPLTRVTLVDTHTGKSHDAGIQSGSCAVIEQSAWKLLDQEISGVICWWAGGGTEIGVFQEGDALRIKTGLVEEGTAETAGSRGGFKTMFSL